MKRGSMDPTIEKLMQELTQVRMEQALDEALLVFSDASTLQILIDVTASMEEALEKEAWDEVPNLDNEVKMFLELHSFEEEHIPAITKALLVMQITINKEVIEYIKRVFQDVHNEQYLQDRMEYIHSLLDDRNPFEENN